ncbi:aspartate-semialdehyde dehydrogenase [Coprothermobacter platensis]|uniref:aspartate-semialdehyde dehydrogenase n=1 Tax=Coprothermobacter platensis TaxID=108819 RepID=UPI00036A69F2|nr:aspartate-semialdehyde dehydrogenase [Coprothermobacter platensis]
MKRVAILGATGLVGQRFVQLLANHPYFEISALAASNMSAAKPYKEAVAWRLDTPIPENVMDMIVQECKPTFECDYVFSALPSDIAGPIEDEFINAGYTVFSNAASHRMDDNVPLVIPEVNYQHMSIVQSQHTNGKIITNPNCSTIGLVMALKPIADLFDIEEVHVVTMQALSGAGYPGVSSLDVVDNVYPYINGEEEKIMTESKKILGNLNNGSIKPALFDIFAQCNRVPVVDGHLLSVFVKTKKPADVEQIKGAINNFQPLKTFNLPSAPEHPLVYLSQKDTPQPRLHRNLGRGMTVSVGQLTQFSERSLRFLALVHNTIRGAAGCAILNAEMYETMRY